MVILGIGGLGYRDAAAALVVDGALVAAASEDRFTRIKHQGGWPKRSVAWCLKQAGVRMEDVDRVAVANNPWVPLREKVLGWYGEKFFESREFRAFHIFHDETRESLLYLKALEDLRRGGTDRVQVVRHHLSHAAAGFLSLGEEEAAILVVDGRGEVSTSSLGIGRGAGIEVFRVEEMPHSLGLLSAAVADFLGFQEQDDEFRVMSISATGEPRYKRQFAEIVRLELDGGFSLNPDYFTFHEGRAVLSERFHDTLGIPRRPGGEVEERHRDIAASLQGALEDAVLHMARALRSRTKSDLLVVSGSLANNWALNGRLAREGIFRRVVATAYCGDDGTAIGAALHIAAKETGRRPLPVPSPALGPDLTDADVDATLEACHLRAERPKDPAAAAAALVAEGKVVGWARGRAEFGPRALGNRSILADAQDARVAERLRKSVKPRESHHPYGISVTREAAASLLEDGSADPFMLVPAVTRKDQRGRIPGVVLADGTVRVHVAARDADPAFHALLEEVGRRRGLAAVVNTSLNLPARPPATTAREVLECYFTTGMDALVLGSRLLRKDAGA
jgi:carbamoyltransferase